MPEAFSAPSSSSDPGLADRLRAATLGEYEIMGELGHGGMASVYLAHEIALDRKVAIKVMTPVFAAGDGMADRFKREARTAAALSHPNIIPIYAVREVDGLLFFVMKVVQGTTLDEVLREIGQLPIATVEALLGQVGNALGYAHRRGVTHRDVKPGNVMIDEEGWAVVTDFGIAKVEEAAALTVTGMALGTPLYMSPEQCAGGTVTGASDQYSLGAVAFEMLTGRPPYGGTGLMAIMYSHCNDPVPSVTALRPDCPEPLARAIERMLAKAPADRWPSMEDVVNAIGARALAPDDPARSQLVEVAKTGINRALASRVQTPRSPIPMRRSGQESAVTAAGAASPRALPLRGAALVVASAAITLAAVAVWRWNAAEPSAPAADSVPTATVAAPAVPPPGALVPPPAAPSVGPGARVTSPSEARATGTVASSEQPASRTAAPVPAPAPPPGPAVPVDSAPPTRVVDSALVAAPKVVEAPTAVTRQPEIRTAEPIDEVPRINQTIEAYTRALAGADLAAAAVQFPGMPSKDRDTYRGFFGSGGRMRPRWNLTEVRVEGAVATGRVTGVTEFQATGGKPDQQAVNLRARFERRPAGWVITALVN